MASPPLSAEIAKTTTRTRATMATEIPEAITIPDRVETRLGTLTFFDGFPDEATVAEGLRQPRLPARRAGGPDRDARGVAGRAAQGPAQLRPGQPTVSIFESLMDSRSLFLTPNTESIYALAWLDLKNGPVVVETPPNVLGLVDDFWFHYVTDMGNAGPDKGQGGKFLFLPPGYAGAVPPTATHVFRPRTFGNIVGSARLPGERRPEARASRASSSASASIRLPSQAAQPAGDELRRRLGAGRSTRSTAKDFSFFEEVNQVVQEEPSEAIDPETLGLLASIGIEKGKPFAPDARMKKILTEAAAVGQRDGARHRVPDPPRRRPTSTRTAPGARRSSAAATSSSTTACACSMRVSSVLLRHRDHAGDGREEGRHRLAVRGRVRGRERPTARRRQDLQAAPAAEHPGRRTSGRSSLYDNQTRSMLQTDQQFPSISSQKRGVCQQSGRVGRRLVRPEAADRQGEQLGADRARQGLERLLRLYGPLQPLFDKTWRPGEIEEVT